MKKFIILIVVLIGTGCASSFEESFYSRVQRLENGMTENDVWKLLGPPPKVRTKKNKKLFIYFPDKEQPNRPYFIRLKDSEVVGWGPAKKRRRK